MKTLQLLDSQFQWDNLQKSQFYKVPTEASIVRIHFPDDYANCGHRCKQNILFLTLSLHAIKALDLSMLWGFVMIIAQVNLFYTMTPPV